MKKADYRKRKQQFARDMDEMVAVYVDTSAVVETTPLRLSLVAEQTFLSAAIWWELFVTELFAAYINRDASNFAKSRNADVEAAVTEKFGAEFASHVKVSLPTHPTLNQVERLVDPREQNVTFKDADDMVRFAQKWLAPTDAARFSRLGKSDRLVLDLVKALRNFIAHGSVAARKRFNDQVQNAALPAPLYRRKYQVQRAGAYLKAVEISTGYPRVVLLLEELKRLALSL